MLEWLNDDLMDLSKAFNLRMCIVIILPLLMNKEADEHGIR